MKINHLLTWPPVLMLAACATPSDRPLFLEADSNKDGRLTLAEVNAVGLPRLFNRYDMNGDGSVTLAEARVVEANFPETQFHERDLNRDGKVSREEFDKVSARRGGLKKRFAGVDTNGDGFIDKAEADAYVAKLEAQTTAP